MTDCDFLCILMPACFIVVQLLSDSCQIHGYDKVYSPREAVICYVMTWHHAASSLIIATLQTAVSNRILKKIELHPFDSKLSISCISYHRKIISLKKLDALVYIFVAESLGTRIGISSTTIAQCSRNGLPNSAKEHKIRAITLFKAIQCHRFWYRSKAHIQLPISD